MKKDNKFIVPIDNFEIVEITNDYIEEYESVIANKLFKIIINGKCPFDDFFHTPPKTTNNLNKIFEEITAIFTLLIEDRDIPPNKIYPIGDNEFEIRVKRSRLYYFYLPPLKNIIVLGHFNKRSDNQQNYIDKFRKIKNKYLNQLRNEQI